jgi:hypothetical protein
MEMLSPKLAIAGNAQKIIQGELHLDVLFYNIHIT